MEKKRPRGRIFRWAVIGLGLLITADVLALGFILVKITYTGRVHRAMHKELTQQQALWREQGITSYRVSFSLQTNGVSWCEGTMLTVRSGVRSPRPDCTPAPNAYGFDLTQAHTMLELFNWLEQRFILEDDWEQLIVEYDPDLHYIRKIVWQSWEWGPLIEVTYSDLVESS